MGQSWVLLYKVKTCQEGSSRLENQGKRILRVKLECLSRWSWEYNWMRLAWSPLPVTNCWRQWCLRAGRRS